MKHRILTAARIASTKPTDHDLWLSDDHGVRGIGRLVLRISPGDVRRFYLRLRGKAAATIPLGFYSMRRQPGFLTLVEARAAAQKLAASLSTSQADQPVATPSPKPASTPPNSTRPSDGKGALSALLEPRPAEPIQHERTGADAGMSIMELAQAYVAKLRREGKISAPEVEAIFRRYLFHSEIGGYLAGQVSTETFVDFLRSVDAGARTKDKLRSYLRSAYECVLCARNSITAPTAELDKTITSNPIATITVERQQTLRFRNLSRAELTEFWRILHPADERTLSIEMRALRLDMLLAGQRCDQLLRVELGNVNLDLDTILLFDPKGRRQTARPHSLPLLPKAKAEVRWLVDNSSSLKSRWLFTDPFSGALLRSERVSRFVTELSRKMLKEKLIDAQFQFSDLRRTTETTLSSLGVRPDYIAQVLSHGISGVQIKHYNRHDYSTEKRATLKLWEEYLEALLHPAKGKKAQLSTIQKSGARE